MGSCDPALGKALPRQAQPPAALEPHPRQAQCCSLSDVSVGQAIVLFRLPTLPEGGRVEKPAEVEENKDRSKSEHSAKRGPGSGRFFMKFRGPQALPNRPQSAMVCPTKVNSIAPRRLPR